MKGIPRGNLESSERGLVSKQRVTCSATSRTIEGTFVLIHLKRRLSASLLPITFRVFRLWLFYLCKVPIKMFLY
ncbi:hypothetical protein TNCV_4000761 [Trichonephila clavipes]|nr:hypothetical protein TNCV_4000761 [Trichonephila clavipes]